jgi:uncharacterized protein YjiK
MKVQFALVSVAFFLTVSCARSDKTIEESASARKVYKLHSEQRWQLDLPNNSRFDASGLLFYKSKLLTISDRSSDLWEVQLSTNSNCKLLRTGWFTYQQLVEASHSADPGHDCEGIAADPNGSLYISEEKGRAIYRWRPGEKKIEKLKIDFSPVRKYFSKLDDNASFEGIAIGGGKLYVANERSDPRIIVVDLETLKIEDDFAVNASSFAFGGPHYSDLSWFDGHLFVLDRNHRVILEVNPKTKQVVAEFSFAEMELEPEVAYHTIYPTGTMEGLAVDEKYFWLVTDNNGKARYKHPDDHRPTLFKCKRPS